jgi:hypothetical protein
MVWEIDLTVEEVGRGEEGFRDVCKHVGHCLIDASPVRAAVDLLAILGECGKVERFGGAMSAKFGHLGTVTEPVVERCFLRREVGPGGAKLVRDGQHRRDKSVQVEAVKVA